MEGSLVLTAAKSLETMSFSPPVTKKNAAEPEPEVQIIASITRNAPCKFDWMQTPRAARVRHKYIGNAEPTPRPTYPRMRLGRGRQHVPKSLEPTLKSSTESESAVTNLKVAKRKRDCRGDSPTPRSPNFLVGTKRKYVEDWLKSLDAINSTKLDKPFGGWQSTAPENGPKKDCN